VIFEYKSEGRRDPFEPVFAVKRTEQTGSQGCKRKKGTADALEYQT